MTQFKFKWKVSVFRFKSWYDTLSARSHDKTMVQFVVMFSEPIICTTVKNYHTVTQIIVIGVWLGFYTYIYIGLIF